MDLRKWEAEWQAAPKRVAPTYDISKPNAPVRLHRAKATITSEDGKSVSGICALTFRWLPRTQVTATIDEPENRTGSEAFNELLHGPCKLIFDDLPIPANVLMRSAGPSGYQSIVNGQWFTAEPAELASFRFHLVNLPDIHGRSIAYETAKSRGYSASRVALEAEGWAVTIDAVDAEGNLQRELRDVGGYAVTHVGVLTRSDGAPFTPKDGQAVLVALHWFLGFSQGAWCGPALKVGYDESGRVVMRDFGPPLCSPFQRSQGWFAHERGETLEELWPLFLTRWADPKWQSILRRAIWWYVSSESEGLGADGSLILAQAGLELLAWSYVVDARKLIGSKSFDGLSTADRFRLLLSSFDQSFDFYKEHKALSDLASRKKWSVAPWAATEVRNRLVHPKNSADLDSESLAIHQASELTIHYLELALLFMLGFRGTYTNRITCQWHGTTEQVPWARNKDTSTS